MSAPENLPSQCYIEHFRGPFATAPRKRFKFERTPIRKALVAAYLLIVLAGLVLGMIAAAHVTHRTDLTVGQAHIKAMY
ncbi:hypothetical protein [Sulfitobacter pacificus]|uniref:hypothetical protein n=1 Tax=Sulfitobacter pacificus TaxID=1499314 RepID=UPI00310488A9